MADDGLKETLFGMKKPKSPPPEDDDDAGPCASRATPKWWPGFHIKNAKLIPENTPTTRSIDYSHMGYREFDPSGAFFVIEVNEPEKWRIRVEGRALWKIYNYLHQHRLEWIEPAVGRSAMAVADGVPVIERITIQRIEDEGEDDPPKEDK